MHRRIARAQSGVLRAHVAAGEVGHHAARLADQQNARRDVPRRQPLLPEGIEATSGDVGQVEGGGSGPPDAAGPRRDAGELGQVLARVATCP